MPALELAARVTGLVPISDPAIFFCTGGGEAIDTAAKIVRRYWAITGEPERTVIVSRRHAYHGTNAYGTSLSGIPAVRDGFGTLVGGVAEVAHDDPDDLARTLDALGDTAAAFVGEPLIGAGGAIPPPDGYWPAVERICRERGVLLIADEVISGFGRLGRWFGCERYGFTPDLMTCAKGISSGYVPLGAVVVSDRVRAPFWDVGRRPVPARQHLRGPPGGMRRRPREHRHPRAGGAGRAGGGARAGARRLLEPLLRAPGRRRGAVHGPRGSRRARRRSPCRASDGGPGRRPRGARGTA